MGLLRSLFRIVLVSRFDDGGGIVPDRPTYHPPEDTLALGTEEIFVTIALLVLSCVVLATPCFSKRRAWENRLGARPEPGSDRGWTEAAKRLIRVRNWEDLK